MTPSQFTRFTALFLVALAIACSSARMATPATATQPPSRESEPSYIAQAKADSARRPYTTADVHFMSRMIGHHAQAITMSNLAPTHGASASVRTLAARIINAQQDEITTMQQWLRDRLQPVPDARATGMKMMMNGVEHEMPMPGMITGAQMKQLDAARGSAFDRLFLSFMIQHHKGAVSMVEDLLGSHGAAQDETVFKLASDLNVDQSTEIARMEKMLVSLTHNSQP